ncbi:MAG: TIGR03936 family radical SAM-associated protein [Sphaerochaetaceae bacterium]|nr:TIGR03936 family radical SAM-associated protein [Sphaerochaetaceae bacterium]
MKFDKYGRLTDLEELLRPELLETDNPARYFGSEFVTGKTHYEEGNIKCAMCFPDLYEIGMSNNAIRIIYDIINRVEGAYCDRVFAVTEDFEALLRKKNIPLFTIRDHFPVNKLDMLGISIGYELCATNILQVLDLGGVALDKKDRVETDPVVIAGGPASTNPAPFAKFFDFIYIGEAETDFANIIKTIGKYKSRSERIEALKSIKCLWYEGKKEITKRAVDTTFGTDRESPRLEHAVVPSFQVAQDHGTVEIMRGCPNGCRFCHAGQYYKPFRQRNLKRVYELVRQNIEQFGYDEITLSSLSSGDYPDLDLLIKALNLSFKSRGVSFSLPSLKVSSFSLDILEQLAEVRKSGLTFAIETPDILDQRSMNKEVPVEQVIEIIKEARARGWKLAKFYFMTGLPIVDRQTEQQSIVSFLSRIRTETKINMNINIGTFIPKAHTSFQWAQQMGMEESAEHLKSIKRALMAAIPGIKVSYHEPSVSYIEGVVSRGGFECADLIQRAYELGCRMDAWSDHFSLEKWQQAISDLNYNFKNGFDENETLPWDSVSMNVSKAFLLKEWKKAQNRELTSVCTENCTHNCGVCAAKDVDVIRADNSSFDFDSLEKYEKPQEKYEQVIFTYEKTGKALYSSHIAVMRHFEMAFQRSSLDVLYTQGFNPKPKMEFLNPVTMGVSGLNELLLTELPVSQINAEAVSALNNALSEGFKVKSFQHIKMPESGKKYSLASHMLGSLYTIRDIKDPSLEYCLKEKLSVVSDDYSVSCSDGVYTVKTKGEKNLFKMLFPSDISKFYIAGSCTITREQLYLSDF